SRALNKAMNRTASAALAAADVAVLVVEAPKWMPSDELGLQSSARTAHPAIVAVNKIDRVRPRERLLPYLGELAARHAFRAVVRCSALKANNMEPLRTTTAAPLPLSPALFPDGELTDRGLPFRIAEM